MPMNLFYELKKYEDISYADPFKSTPMLCLCRTSQSNILAKKCVITQMGIGYTKCKNPPFLTLSISIKQARGEIATQISSFKMCLMARA